MSLAHLSALGWGAELAEAYARSGRTDLLPFRVAAVHRGRVVLRDGRGPDRMAPVAGALAHRQATAPVAGDWVLAGGEAGPAEAVLPRQGVLARGDEVLASHVDLVLVATSANRDVNHRRLERFLAMAAGGAAAALVLLTKADLAEDPAGAAAALARAVDCPVLATSVPRATGLAELRARLAPGRTAALVGSSGVGKSSLVNALLGAERQRTLAIRPRDDRGRHATRHRELFALPGGALLLDTPGVRMPALADAGGLADAFADVERIAAGCRFGDCAHAGEPGCAVAAAVAAGELDASRVAARRALAREAETQRVRVARRGGSRRPGSSPDR